MGRADEPAVGTATGGRVVVADYIERQVSCERLDVASCFDRARLGILLSGACTLRLADGRRRRVDRPVLIGPSTVCYNAELAGDVHIFYAVLTPPAWGDLCGGRSIRMVDRVVRAAALLGRGIDALVEPMRAAPDFDARRRIVDDHLSRVAAACAGGLGDRSFDALIERWLGSTPRPLVEELVRMSGLSRRQVERHCKIMYGVPPRMLARRHRALRAADRLAAAAGVAEVIGDGFYDQSHLIRELKHFTGATPRHIERRQAWRPF